MKLQLLLATIVALSGQANGQLRELWHLGEDDGSVNDFTQELGGSAAEPGSPTKRDDDYYFSGIYPDPIGTLTSDERTDDPVDPSNQSANPVGFERAVTSGDTNNRIHFNLSASEADPAASYRFTLDLIGGGFWTGSANGAGFGTHDIQVFFNETLINTTTDITENFVITETINPAEVEAVAGANKIEIVRSGGINATDTDPNAVNGWIVFDKIALEIDESAVACTDALCNFGASAGTVLPGGAVTLNWLTSADASVSIEPGVGAVTAGNQSMIVNPAVTTTYTITSVLGAETSTDEVTVIVNHLNSFTTSVTDVTPTNPNAILSWSVDAASSVSIEPGIGNVDEITSNGFGSIEVTAAADITYTITVTTGADVNTGTVSLDFEYDDYDLLWLLGVKNDSNSDFNQEVGGSNPPPGSPTARDDDYYFAGFYATVGVVAEDEIVIDPVDQSGSSANPVGMERAVTHSDPQSRIHFTLNAGQATASNEYRFDMKLVAGGSAAGGFGTHDIDIFFNGVPIYSEVDITNATPVREHFTAESVNAVVGENVIEVVRTGGANDPANPGVSNGWIQFDFFSLESRASTASPLGFQISSFSHDATAGRSTMTFPSSPGQTFKIETSLDLDSWTEVEAMLPAHGTESETSYHLNQAQAKAFVRVTRN
ncbi:hypothetical protein V2O64_19775 [Verrucomicrobiaceae bacterium 227]